MNEQLSPEQLAKILDIRKDFYRYCSNNLYIKDKRARIVKFKPNVAQRALIDYVLWCIKHGKPIRVIILKARQMGLSTAVEALIYWWTSTNKNITSVIIGHEDKSAKNLYMMFRRYYDNTNPLFKPSVNYNTRADLTFERYDETGKQVGLGSVIKTATAKNTSAGRSDTIQCLHASEVGEWENGEELVASIMQTVPYETYMEKPTMIFLESTAKGRGNYFHKEWRAAEKGENNFTPFFFPWWIMPGYVDYDDEPLGELTEYEAFLMELMEAGYHTEYADIDVPAEEMPARIKFYRRKSKDFASDPAKMFQEYPSTSHEAFIASGRAVFDVMALERLEKDAPELIDIEHYKIEPGMYEGQVEIEHVPYDERIEDNNGPLKIWEHPKPGREYVIGADVAEGLKHGDYSVAEVVDISTMETVARWRGHVDPDRFGEILSALGTYYNYGLIGVEVNNHGLTTVQKLRDIFYTNLFKRTNDYEKDFEEPTVNLGWKTDMRTKRIAIDDLIRLIREGVNKDKDKVFIEEAFAFVRDDRGRMNAEEGEHDDTVMAKAITFQLFPWGENDISKLEVYKPKATSNTKSKHKLINKAN